MTKKGSLDFLLLIYYIESRRRLRGKEDERTMTGCPFITGTPTGRVF
jgi:hypothetical protein